MAVAPAAADPLRVVIDAEPAHLNPVLDPDLWGYRITHDLICEPLWRPVPGRGDLLTTNGYQGVLAESFRLDEDHAGVAVVLRKGVRFHDGRPFTSKDVRFTLERLHESSRTAPRTQALLADLYRVEVISDTRVHLLFRRASGRILMDLAEIDMLPEHLFGQGSLAYQPANRRPVGTGPYRFKEWRRSGSGRNARGEVVLVRDPGYWGGFPETGAPAEELRFLVVPDAARGLAKLHRGEAEILGRLPPLYSPEQVDPTALRGRQRPIEIPGDQVLMLLWNRHHPVLSSARVRRALSLLVDRNKLVQEVRHGLGEPLGLPPPLPPGPVALDEAAAAALLDEAGLLRGGETGPRARGGRPVRLTVLVPAGSSEAQAVFRRLAEAAGRAGIALEAAVEDLGTLKGRVRRGAFDAALLAWSWTGAEPDLSLLLRSGPQAVLGMSGTPNNDSQDLDAALDALHRASAPGSRQSALERIAALLQEFQPVTFLYRPRQLILVDQRLLPFVPPRVGDFLQLRALSLSGPP